MKSNRGQKAVESVETTIGELVEVITKLALEVGATEEEGYQLASLTLETMLKRSNRGVEIFDA